MKVKVDRALCGGTGLCAEICPTVFAQDPDYVAYVKQGGVRTDTETGVYVPSDCDSAVQEAATACPTGAVVIQGD